MMFSASWDKVKVYTNADSEGNFSFKVTVPEASTKTYALHIYELQKKGNRDVVIASRNITQVYAGEVIIKKTKKHGCCIELWNKNIIFAIHNICLV